jgi:hypothetical protein
MSLHTRPRLIEVFIQVLQLFIDKLLVLPNLLFHKVLNDLLLSLVMLLQGTAQRIQKFLQGPALRHLALKVLPPEQLCRLQLRSQAQGSAWTTPKKSTGHTDLWATIRGISFPVTSSPDQARGNTVQAAKNSNSSCWR